MKHVCTVEAKSGKQAYQVEGKIVVKCWKGGTD